MEMWICDACELRYSTVQPRCACGGRLVGADELLTGWRRWREVVRVAGPHLQEVRRARAEIGSVGKVHDSFETALGSLIGEQVVVNDAPGPKPLRPKP